MFTCFDIILHKCIILVIEYICFLLENMNLNTFLNHELRYYLVYCHDS